MPFGPDVPGETPVDPSGLRNKSIANRRELNIAEAEAIRKVVVKYLSRRPTTRTAPFNLIWALQLHKEMLGDVWHWAGKLRTRDFNLGVPFFNISADLHALLDDLAHWTDLRMSLVEQAARLHHRAVRIHPFENGNGRWSRLLANIWLKQNRAPITDWPEAVIGEESAVREDYLTAVKAADSGDYDRLIELHQQYAEKA